MINYAVCGGIGIIEETGAAYIGDDRIRFSPVGPGAKVTLYRTDTKTFSECPVQNGEAVFDGGFIVCGGEYRPVITGRDGYEIDCLPFTVIEKQGKLCALRKQTCAASEISKLWRCLLEVSRKAERSAEIAGAAAEKVVSLIDGYRTE